MRRVGAGAARPRLTGLDDIRALVAPLGDAWLVGGCLRDAALGAPVTDVEKEARARAIVRIAALGRQWRVTADPEVKRGYLLTGKALLEAALYADEDPDISDLVKASQKDADAARRLRRIAWALAGAVAVAAVGGYLFLYLSAKAAAERQQQAFNRARAESLFAENKKLQQANAATTLEKDQFKSSAQKAVDAIGHDDLTPLKQFLQRFGDADPKQLDRLVLSAPTATSIEATSAKAPVADRRILASAQAYAPTEATCAGYLWFGSAQDSRLSDRRDPTTLKAGDTVTLDTRADIRMRSDWPAPETYAMSPQTGLAPGGSTVKLTGDIRQYARGAQQQVLGRITRQRQFGGRQYPRAAPGRLLRSGDNPVGIAAKIADHLVQLRCGDSHRRKRLCRTVGFATIIARRSSTTWRGSPPTTGTRWPPRAPGARRRSRSCATSSCARSNWPAASARTPAGFRGTCCCATRPVRRPRPFRPT